MASWEDPGRDSGTINSRGEVIGWEGVHNAIAAPKGAGPRYSFVTDPDTFIVSIFGWSWLCMLPPCNLLGDVLWNQAQICRPAYVACCPTVPMGQPIGV